MLSSVTVVEAQGLQPTLSQFVECQYTFLDCPDLIVVPPDLGADEVTSHRRLVRVVKVTVIGGSILAQRFYVEFTSHNGG